MASNQKLVDYQVASDAQINALKAQIDRKEFQMQRMELKIYNYEKYLQRKALNDPEAAQLLKKFESRLSKDSEDQRLTNVVEDNNNLRAELKEAMIEINRLDAHNQSLQDRLAA